MEKPFYRLFFFLPLLLVYLSDTKKKEVTELRRLKKKRRSNPILLKERSQNATANTSTGAAEFECCTEARKLDE